MKHIALAAVVALAGCASSTNMRIGTDQSYVSLQDQRAAAIAVTESAVVPESAKELGPVDASRCHRHQGAIEPGRDILIGDLKVAAYARGADGIAHVVTRTDVGLGYNCYYIITATATMFRTAK
jgi:hypothetical protein